MSEPIVLITTHKIKDGNLAGFRKRNQDIAVFIYENKPVTGVFLSNFPTLLSGGIRFNPD